MLVLLLNNITIINKERVFYIYLRVCNYCDPECFGRSRYRQHSPEEYKHWQW